MSTSVGIIEDQPLMQPGLAFALGAPEFQVEFVLAKPTDLVDALERSPIAVLVADLPVDSNRHDEILESMARVRSLPNLSPPAFVILSRDRSVDSARQVMERGALAFLVTSETSDSDLRAAVTAAARGGGQIHLDLIAQRGGLREAPPVRRPSPLAILTAREREVAQALSSGADNLKIAALLGISERTVKAHVGAIYRKLHVENRVELALACLRSQFAPPDDASSDPVEPAKVPVADGGTP